MPGERVTVAVAESAVQAEIWMDALRRAGIQAMSFERGPGAAMGGAATVVSAFPVLVGAAELGAARSVIADIEGARVLAPFEDTVEPPAWLRYALLVAALGVAVLVLLAAGTRFAGG